jgi:hypothetical protein
VAVAAGKNKRLAVESQQARNVVTYAGVGACNYVICACGLRRVMMIAVLDFPNKTVKRQRNLPQFIQFIFRAKVGKNLDFTKKSGYSFFRRFNCPMQLY